MVKKLSTPAAGATWGHIAMSGYTYWCIKRAVDVEGSVSLVHGVASSLNYYESSATESDKCEN
jgi:hypothetical protein